MLLLLLLLVGTWSRRQQRRRQWRELFLLLPLLLLLQLQAVLPARRLAYRHLHMVRAVGGKEGEPVPRPRAAKPRAGGALYAQPAVVHASYARIILIRLGLPTCLEAAGLLSGAVHCITQPWGASMGTGEVV